MQDAAQSLSAPTAGPDAVALRLHGYEFRVTIRPAARAERCDARGRTERVWPTARLIEIDPVGQPCPVAGCQLPAGLGWREIFPRVSGDRLLAIARFPVRHWHLLEFASNHRAFADLLQSNPVLALALACNDEFRSAPPWVAAARAAHGAARKQREIAGLLGFPATGATVHLLGRIRPEAAHPAALRLLRQALPLQGPAAAPVFHARDLNAGALAFLVQPLLAPLLTPRLLQEILESPAELDHAPAADLLLDTLRMRQMMPEQDALRTLVSRRQIQELHDRTTLACRAHQERVRLATLMARERFIRENAIRTRPAVRAIPRPKAACVDEAFPRPPIPGTATILPLETPAELKLESAVQRNCVDTYGPIVRSGEQYLYRMLAPERATLSVARGAQGRWHLRQIKGPANRSVSELALAAAHEWLDAHEVSRRPPGARPWPARSARDCRLVAPRPDPEQALATTRLAMHGEPASACEQRADDHANGEAHSTRIRASR